MPICRRRSFAVLAAVLFVTIAHGQWVEDSIESGRFVNDLVYNYRFGRMLGVSWEADRLFSIECGRNLMTHTLSLSRPLHITYNATTNRVYCTFGNGADDTVVVAHGTDVEHWYKRIPLAGAWRPLWDSVSNRVYVACGLENDVAVIDCVSDSVICRIPVGENPSALELNTLHRKLYVRNWDGESVSIIDLETNQVIGTVRPGSVPQMGCYSAAVDKYYLGMEASEVVVIDGAGDSIIRRIDFPSGNSPEAITIAGSSQLLMVGAACPGDDSVFVVDMRTDTVVAAYSLGSATPRAMLWSPHSDLVYCAGWDDVVNVLRGDGSGFVCQLRVGYAPAVLAVAPDYGRVYVGHSGSPYVFVIRDVVGIAEEPVRVMPARPVATLTRGRLRVAEPGRLYDTGGRQVCVLRRGENDVRHLAPGVYTVHTVTGALSRVVKVR